MIFENSNFYQVTNIESGFLTEQWKNAGSCSITEILIGGMANKVPPVFDYRILIFI